MYDRRVTLHQQVSEQIQTHFGDRVFKTAIPRNVRLAEAPSHGVPGVKYDKKSRGAKAYIKFGHELLSRLRSEEHTSELQSRGHLVCRLLLEIINLTIQLHEINYKIKCT